MLYLVLLAVCLLSVLKVLPAWVAAVVVALAVALRQPDLLGKVDWALLATFLCFFIFVGNVKAAPVVSQTLEQLLTGRETLVGGGMQSGYQQCARHAAPGALYAECDRGFCWG